MKWWQYGYVLILVLVLGAFNTFYINHVAAENEQKFCSVVGRVVDAYRGSPPESELGRQLYDDYVNLQKELGCVR